MTVTILTAVETTRSAPRNWQAWCRVDTVFASPRETELEAETGSMFDIVSCLKKPSGQARYNTVNVTVTGNPDDHAEVTVSWGQHRYSATITGVVVTPTRRWVSGDLTEGDVLVFRRAFDHRQKIKDAGGRFDPEDRNWVLTVTAPSAAAKLATWLSAAGVTVALQEPEA